MNRKIINQALKFENLAPTYSQVKELCSLVAEYQSENGIYFLQAKRGEQVIIKDEGLFFVFLSQTQNINCSSFSDLHKLLNPSSRAENIESSGNSKNSYIAVFDSVVLFKKRGEFTQLYQKSDLEYLESVDNILAIENGETFLNIERYLEHFDEEYFVYISGYSNSLTREFLSSKNVTFFVDYDIEGMNIYESFSCKSKHLHIAKNLESYFLNKKYHNVALYEKQRKNLKKEYSKELEPVIGLIKKYSTVVEQEIIYEAS